MASCVLTDTSGEATGDFHDTVVFDFQVDLGEIVINPLLAIAMAQAIGPEPVPQRLSQLTGHFLFATSIAAKRQSNRNYWGITVTFTRPDGGQDERQFNPNPLERPPLYNVTYQEQEYVVKRAKNVEAMGFNFDSGVREANTLGPIVNSAFRRPDEPIIRQRRVGIITIERNLADLGDVMDRNEDFQDTTNSDEITLGNKTFSARRLKFEVCESPGRQEENDVVFFPSITQISIYKTTDLQFDNVGFEYWDVADGLFKRAKDGAGEETAEPINLNLDGTPKVPGILGDSGPSTITYRDLTETAYADFFEE